mmetsp:Transcript_4039/g.7238  ORF Transcript_4039/g.7238 Transcript_4039/m.7238 type:complete len:114 (+) Transcript_4039:825-1166(+)
MSVKASVRETAPFTGTTGTAVCAACLTTAATKHAKPSKTCRDHQDEDNRPEQHGPHKEADEEDDQEKQVEPNAEMNHIDAPSKIIAQHVRTIFRTFNHVAAAAALAWTATLEQ